jgi:hypothetical protein
MVDVGRIRTRARKLSKSLLGAQFRAEVAAFIKLGTAPFWARGMSKQLDIPENKVAAELSRFADENLLIAMSGSDWDRRTLYQPASNSASYWAVGVDFLRRAATEEALRVGAAPEDAFNAYLATLDSSAHSEHSAGSGS